MADANADAVDAVDAAEPGAAVAGPERVRRQYTVPEIIHNVQELGWHVHHDETLRLIEHIKGQAETIQRLNAAMVEMGQAAENAATVLRGLYAARDYLASVRGGQ